MPFPIDGPLEQDSISNGFRDIQVDCNAMVDLTFIRPLNKGQGHSFWYQSISHIRLPKRCHNTFRTDYRRRPTDATLYQ